ncbi:hypothetical protein Pen02_00720 [Plantactinospora endophytica]|uniref:Uncharacterized protein n=1 Tax=Plantactinospora endophytica TaxID=673535 RepID=A0ABQ4DRQ8_9ACTN|nr:hypothetical protein Pen02_00720 [Plantactinospora endophytica]
MSLWRRWREYRLDKWTAEVERVARAQDAAEAEAARQRVLEMARRQRDDPDRGTGPEPAQPAHTRPSPTSAVGLPPVTYLPVGTAVLSWLRRWWSRRWPIHPQDYRWDGQRWRRYQEWR